MDYDNKTPGLERPDKFYDDIGDQDQQTPGKGSLKKKNLKKKQPKSKKAKDQEKMRKFSAWAICGVLVLLIVVILFSRIFPDNKNLEAPQKAVTTVMTPIESAFSSITNSIAGSLQNIKLRTNIEKAYEDLRTTNEQLTYENMDLKMQLEELRGYKELNDEYNANIAMNPLIANVINREGENYFSVFSINKGSNDGLEPFMAVTFGGGLVGYIDEVQPTRSKVRAVIDTGFNIAAIIESSRGQGTVSGTLGIDGEPMCRMYYYQSGVLPRPGDVVISSGVGVSFPKGIPIGTVRESTRGMQDNKSYIVIEPMVKFDSLEYVLVLRYKPDALPVTVQNISDDLTLVPVATPFAYLPEGVGNEDPNASPSPSPDANQQGTPAPSSSLMPSSTPGGAASTGGANIEYNVPKVDENQQDAGTAEATPTPEPTKIPETTVSLDDLTIE